MTASWRQFETEAADLAAFVKRRFEAHGLALLATLRADGSPRVSGIEPAFAGGELWLGMMPRSVKGADLRRDRRFALHNATIDKDVRDGDVKVNGFAVPVVDEQGLAAFADASGHAVDPAAMELFRAELSGVAAIHVSGDHLLIESWRPGQQVRSRQRY